MKRILPILAVVAFTFAPPSLASAQGTEGAEDAGGTETIYKNNQEINFEGLDVQGEIKKPQGAYLLERKKSKFSPLIKFKLNFDEEVAESLDQEK